MASSIHRSWFSLLSVLVLVVGFLGQVTNGRSIIMSTNSAEKVSLGLYYESLCPYSANFIINELSNIFKNGLIDIVDLQLYPWGNAKINPNSTFVCQHGPNECFFNTVEACAIEAWPDLSGHYPFIDCVEKLAYDGKSSQWETCFQTLKLDPAPVKDCYTNGLGNKLELKYAAETESLKPPHEYVPWVVVDGQPLYEDYENFTTYICKAYKGPKPSACNDLSSKKTIKQVHPVTFRDGEVKAAPWLKNVKSSVSSRLTGVLDKAVM